MVVGVVQVQVMVNVSYSNDACEMRTMILQRHVLEDEDDEFAHLPFDGPFPRRATMDSCVGDNGPSTVAVDNGHARGGGPRFLTVKPPDDMMPEAEVVHSAEAEGRVDLLAIVDLVAILGPVRPSDARANASVAAPIRPLAIIVAVMGEL